MTSEMDYFLKLLDACNRSIENFDSYEYRCLGRDVVDGLIVSTANTIDMGYETAIINRNPQIIVERYEDKEQAKAGHSRWLKKVVGMKEAVDIGYGSIIKERVCKLNRLSNKEILERMNGLEQLQTINKSG